MSFLVEERGGPLHLYGYLCACTGTCAPVWLPVRRTGICGPVRVPVHKGVLKKLNYSSSTLMFWLEYFLFKVREHFVNLWRDERIWLLALISLLSNCFCFGIGQQFQLPLGILCIDMHYTLPLKGEN